MAPGGPPFAKASARQALHVGKRQVMTGLDIFQEPFYPKLHFSIQLRFIATFWAPDIVPLSLNRYFLKLSMLLAYKLINRHNILLNENI